MNTYNKQAKRLMDALALAQQPVAVALSDTVPDGVPGFEGVAPAGCAFWQEAATRTFATTAGHHELCAIGIHTHNLSDAPASQQRELQDCLQAMMGLDYIREQEVAAVPVLQREVKHAIYGPLAEFPMDPDLVFLFADAGKGLILSEAVERVDGGIPPAMGRPACAVVPQVLNHGNAAMSLGCCGARAYLDVMSESVALWALPGNKLDQYCEQIDVLARANQTLAVFHQRRRADVEAGQRPTVQESLHRLS